MEDPQEGGIDWTIKNSQGVVIPELEEYAKRMNDYYREKHNLDTPEKLAAFYEKREEEFRKWKDEGSEAW